MFIKIINVLLCLFVTSIQALNLKELKLASILVQNKTPADQEIIAIFPHTKKKFSIEKYKQMYVSNKDMPLLSVNLHQKKNKSYQLFLKAPLQPYNHSNLKKIENFSAEHRIQIFEPQKNAVTIFTALHQHNAWASKESFSGPGSEVAATQSIQKFLPALLKKFNIQSMIDAPCGDFNWLKEIDLPIKSYVGIDIVQELIDNNQKKYKNRQRGFKCLDVIKDAIPHADLILCKDFFQHLPHQEGLKVLRNFKKSKATYLLATTHANVAKNINIIMSDWSPTNLELPPFNLPKPIFIMDESYGTSKDIAWEIKLALWKLKDIHIN